MGVFDRVGLPGAAAVLDADAKSDDFGIGTFGQFGNPKRRGLGQLHDLRTEARLRLCQWCR
jgi:hypothetical protein